MPKKENIPNFISIIKVHQWLDQWNQVQFTDNKDEVTPKYRRKPADHFILFSMSAKLLKKLSGVNQRKSNKEKQALQDDLAIQRLHEKSRSAEIRRFIHMGYPLSGILKKLDKEEVDRQSELLMPGWLPTAIVANILGSNSIHYGQKIKNEDRIIVGENNLELPKSLPKDNFDSQWDPPVLPIEIIDGQHRLWAMDQDGTDNPIPDNYQLPVVAFYDLDITWQAYLFYTINVKPKRINQSLAFDLYPLLRTQEWLEKSPDTGNIYRENRAQEIVESLWKGGKSPWKERINMVGSKGSSNPISQAAFIRSLTTSFFRSRDGNGLFSSNLPDQDKPISWNRNQQAAFIHLLWSDIQECTKRCNSQPFQMLRRIIDTENKKQKALPGLERIPIDDGLFFGKHTFITKDQGVRGILRVVNDLFYKISGHDKIHLDGIFADESFGEEYETLDYDALDVQIKIIKESDAGKILNVLCEEIVKFDWRAASTPDLKEPAKTVQMNYKGSSGYKVLRDRLNEHLKKSDVLYDKMNAILSIDKETYISYWE